MEQQPTTSLWRKTILANKNFSEDGKLPLFTEEDRQALRLELTAWAATPEGVAAIQAAVAQASSPA
jgi:hypothetical protein